MRRKGPISREKRRVHQGLGNSQAASPPKAAGGRRPGARTCIIDLSPQDAERLKQMAPEGRPKRIVTLMLATGIHPAVLHDPVKYKLEYLTGRRVLTWLRPKTMKRCVWKKPGESSDLENLVLAIMREDLGMSTRQYHHDVAMAGKAAGFENVTPLTLRNTGLPLALRVMDIAEVQQIFQATTAVIWAHYGRVGRHNPDPFPRPETT